MLINFKYRYNQPIVYIKNKDNSTTITSVRLNLRLPQSSIEFYQSGNLHHPQQYFQEEQKEILF